MYLAVLLRLLPIFFILLYHKKMALPVAKVKGCTPPPSKSIPVLKTKSTMYKTQSVPLPSDNF